MIHSQSPLHRPQVLVTRTNLTSARLNQVPSITAPCRSHTPNPHHAPISHLLNPPTAPPIPKHSGPDHHPAAQHRLPQPQAPQSAPQPHRHSPSTQPIRQIPSAAELHSLPAQTFSSRSRCRYNTSWSRRGRLGARRGKTFLLLCDLESQDILIRILEMKMYEKVFFFFGFVQ